TYGGSGIAALTAYTALPVSGGSATTNYIATASTTLTAAVSANALLIVGDNITLGGAFSLTATTAEVVAVDTGNTGNNFSSSTTFPFAATEGVLYNAATGASTGGLTINSVLTGSVAAGSVALTIGGPDSLGLAGANTYT